MEQDPFKEYIKEKEPEKSADRLENRRGKAGGNSADSKKRERRNSCGCGRGNCGKRENHAADEKNRVYCVT